ncbi:multicopper oxidase domain-containing protein [Nitrosococcus wardiae]|uniref:Twin-arginine translocation signal domain-containing protein n=1 Tax=Nitrosococcus wardiae TaxID=1814290 RepID=A0A4P7C073_9GAMM|nr:multicopper oxidase domain-containing protein [Nitrosococcus wardiae]QBQ54106.1 twin-arginine translocation signal domain-containing protein [Nitrosococcus wardiae]
MSYKKDFSVSRRRFLKTGAAVGVGAAFGPWVWTGRKTHADAFLPDVTLDPATIPQFVNPLPLPGRIDLTDGGSTQIGMSQINQDLGLGVNTTVWGYNGSYPGPTILARKDVPVAVQWRNNLDGISYPANVPLDDTLHWAESGNEVPTVPHLHGGHNDSDYDGLPEYWWTASGETGPRFVTRDYEYDHSQEAGTLWYHDHALGVTRLNVYMGLAGFYLLRDENEDELINDPNNTGTALPSGPYEAEIVIQDRMFTPDGELYYPHTPDIATQLFGPADYPDATVFAEFFGDVILVNGMAWPFIEVEPRKYRFRLLNGSDTRFYRLFFGGGLKFTQIGTELGMLNAPVEVQSLSIAPGQRADVVVDFSKHAGKTIIMQNNAPGTFRRPLVINPKTTGRIMEFRVSLPLNTNIPDLPLPTNLRPVHGHLPAVDPTTATNTRQVALYEGLDALERLQPLLGTLAGSRAWDNPITENPALNSTELWEIYNTTPDTHPIHLHLVHFQIVNRQKFNAKKFVPGNPATIDLQGQTRPPAPTEAGLLDTVQVPPGEVVRIIATFDKPGRYVWHCHILSHEDHEMMRPYEVI